jgi:probable poly-beta-1,6-N-acetyl-D-glucosamine export protein
MKSSLSPSKNYSLTADVIRVFAILGVVSIHILIAVYHRADFLGGKIWWVTNLLNTLFRPAIPLFVMLSGYLLIPKMESIKKLLDRIIYRLGVPLLSFMLIFKFWNGGHLSFFNLKYSRLFFSLINVNVDILYYLIIAIGLYAVLPLIRKKFLPLNQHRQLLASLVFILIGIGLVGVEYYYQNFFLYSIFLYWLPYLGFFLMGHVLAKYKLDRPKKIIVFALYLAAFVATSLLNYQYLAQINSNNYLSPPGALSPYFDFHLSPNQVVLSLTLYLLLFQFSFKNLTKYPLVMKFIQKISKASFGIYLLHLLVIAVLEKYLEFSVDSAILPLLPFLCLKFAIVLALAYGLTLIFKKTPGLKRMIGEKS